MSIRLWNWLVENQRKLFFWCFRYEIDMSLLFVCYSTIFSFCNNWHFPRLARHCIASIFILKTVQCIALLTWNNILAKCCILLGVTYGPIFMYIVSFGCMASRLYQYQGLLAQGRGPSIGISRH